MCSTVSAKIDERCTVLANLEVAPGFWRMQLQAPRLAGLFKPGQFFQLRIGHGAILLRRPFAPSEIGEESFAFIYAVVGEGTQEMTRLHQNMEVDVLGPLGTGYPFPGAGQAAVLIGGGCGTPSLRFLGEALRAAGTDVYAVIGARSACTLLEVKALEEVSTMIAIATDDGSKGIHGTAVHAARHLLREVPREPAPVLYACGPSPMLAGVAAFAEERSLECFVSLEERMACGFGACMGCVVKVHAENEDGFLYKRVCLEGPVFSAEEIVW